MRLRRPRGDQPATTSPIPTVGGGVLQVCHPDWRGVRSSAEAFGDPILTSTDLRQLVDRIADVRNAGVTMLVIQGWPPGSEEFAREAHASGLDVRAVSHSAPSQHGVDGGEAEAVTDALNLQSEGIISALGTVKAGVSESFATLGYRVDHVPNRVPNVGLVQQHPQDQGINVGIFLFPMWRKNVTTQILATRLLGATPHVMAAPDVGYLSESDLVVHNEMPRSAFLSLLASMTISLNVTLSECHPMMPMESYRLGVPCLMSRTSDLFADDEELWELTTVDRADDPSAIASAARGLMAHRERALDLAGIALDAADTRGREAWDRFTLRGPT